MKLRDSSKMGRPDISTGKVLPPSTGQFSVIPLHVAPVANAFVICRLGSNPKVSAISRHGLPKAAAVRGPIQIAVACDPQQSELLSAARELAPGGAVVVGGAVNSSELLIDRDRVDGSDAAYVCRGRVCDLPVTTGEDLAAALAAAV